MNHIKNFFLECSGTNKLLIGSNLFILLCLVNLNVPLICNFCNDFTGSDLNSELTIRLFLRRLFLDPVAGVHVTNRAIRPNFGVRIANSLSQSYPFVTESKHVNESDDLGNSSWRGSQFLIANISSSESDPDSGNNLESSSSNCQNLPCSSCYSVSPVPRSLSS